MGILDREKKEDAIFELFEQLEIILTELKAGLLEMARDHDECQARIKELEADNIWLCESMEEMENNRDKEVAI